MKQQQTNDNCKRRAQRTQQLYQICNENETPESRQVLTEVGRLIKAGVNISAPQPQLNQSGRTPLALHRAAHEGKTELCRFSDSKIDSTDSIVKTQVTQSNSKSLWTIFLQISEMIDVVKLTHVPDPALPHKIPQFGVWGGSHPQKLSSEPGELTLNIGFCVELKKRS